MPPKGSSMYIMYSRLRAISSLTLLDNNTPTRGGRGRAGPSRRRANNPRGGASRRLMLGTGPSNVGPSGQAASGSTSMYPELGESGY